MLVCVGFMAHVASIDADPAFTVTAAAQTESHEDALLGDLASSSSQMGSHDSLAALCASLGVLGSLMLLVLHRHAQSIRRTGAVGESPHFRAPMFGLRQLLGAGSTPNLSIPLRL
jgi:hypothetical protein